MTNRLTTQTILIACAGIVACGAESADTNDVEGQPQQLVKQLGERHWLSFEATRDLLSVTESVPIGVPALLPTLPDKRP